MFLVPITKDQYDALEINGTYLDAVILGKLFNTANYHKNQYYLVVNKAVFGSETWKITGINI